MPNQFVGENERIARDLCFVIGLTDNHSELAMPLIEKALSKKDAEWGKKVEKLKQPGLSIEDREILLARLALAEKMVGAYENALLDIANDKEFSHNISGNFVREVWYKKVAKEVLAFWE